MENNNMKLDAVNSRRGFVGRVVSYNMQKTLIAEVERTFRHGMLGKVIKRVKKYKVHDEAGVAKVGDIISFRNGRPVSKTKFMWFTGIIGGSSGPTKKLEEQKV